MKKCLKDRRVLVGLVAILLCIAGIAYGVVIAFTPDKVTPPTDSEIMRSSARTVIERKEEDGSISTYIYSGDPIFHDAYPLPHVTQVAQDTWDGTEWKFHVIYGSEGTNPVEFYFGDLWFTENGTVYSLDNIPLFLASLDGICDYLEANVGKQP